MAELREELQKMLDMVGKYADKWMFRCNARNSMAMVVGRRITLHLKMWGNDMLT